MSQKDIVFGPSFEKLTVKKGDTIYFAASPVAEGDEPSIYAWSTDLRSIKAECSLGALTKGVEVLYGMLLGKVVMARTVEDRDLTD